MSDGELGSPGGRLSGADGPADGEAAGRAADGVVGAEGEVCGVMTGFGRVTAGSDRLADAPGYG